MTIGRESFYVAASRARTEFVIYTASTQDLGVIVQISRANENAQDLVTPILQNNTEPRSSVASLGINEIDSSVTEEKEAQGDRSIQTPQQDELSEIRKALTERKPNHSHDESDQRSFRNQPKSDRKRIGFDRIIDSLTDSSRQSEELAANLRDLNFIAATTGADESNSHRETENTGDITTENNRAAAELTRELLHLEQRARSSHLQDRETRKPSSKSHSSNPGQFIAKIKQLARDFFTNSENLDPGEIWSTSQIGDGNGNQTPRTTQGNLDYSVDYQSVDLDARPRFSPQPKATSRNQGQSQQQRNTPQTNREQARKVETSPTPSLSELLDELQRSSPKEEKNRDR